MTLFLNKIQNSFNKASKSYDSVAHIQREAREFLIHQLLTIETFNPKTILDLGTGTGYVPELLLNHYPKSTYVLNDISNKMLEICKVKFSNHSNIAYLHGDMNHLNINAFDLVISNFAFQWVDNLWKTLTFFSIKVPNFLHFQHC